MNTLPHLMLTSPPFRMLRPIVFHLFLAFIMVWLTNHSETIYATPYVPESDSAVLEHVPLSGDPRIRQLRAARMELSQDPGNLALAVQLARQWVELGRTEADPRYDGYAQAALQPWWNRSKPPTDVLFIRAVLRQRRHHFEEALEDLTQILHRQPTQAQTWLTRAVIHQVQGHYQEARKNCLPLLQLTDALVSTTCIAHITSLNGQAGKSYKSLLNILSSTPSADPQLKLWSFTVLAETAARMGNAADAEKHFRQALSLGLRDTYLLAAYSDWLLDQNRPADVQALLSNDFSPDGLLLRVALAAQQLNSPDLPKYIANLTARFTDQRHRGDTRHLREEARFTLHLLKQPHQSLRMAQENWKVQREPWDARMVLEAALAAGDHQAARPVMEWVREVRLEDTRIVYLVEKLT